MASGISTSDSFSSISASSAGAPQSGLGLGLAGAGGIAGNTGSFCSPFLNGAGGACVSRSLRLSQFVLELAPELLAV